MIRELWVQFLRKKQVCKERRTAFQIPKLLGIGPVKSIDDLINYIYSYKSIGDNEMLTVNRNGQIMNLNLVLQARLLSLGNATP
ncbi:MAG TPA: hypothetical protein VFI73_13490 [Candidatus Nitrosopolaris sp.]|nr:hypothetical protein [Candidatus Nitrosopolaris sp.]